MANMKQKLLGVLLGAALMFVAAAPALANPSAPSVVLSGWRFVLDEPGWVATGRVGNDWPYDSNVNSCPGMQGHWKGRFAAYPFYFRAYPKAPKDNKYYYEASANVSDITVVKIPGDLRKSIQDYSIAIYGSPDKVPVDVKKKETEQILTNATGVSVWCLNKYDKKMLITFQGHTAFLKTWEDNKVSVAIIAVLLDNNTIGVITVDVEKHPGSNKAAYSGKAKDVINALTIEKAA